MINLIKMQNVLITLLIVTLLQACHKDPVTPPLPSPTDTIIPAVDPPLAKTIGFFMDDWQPLNFTKPSFRDTTASAAGAFTVTIDPSSIITKIPRSLFGNNANIWMTQMVTEASLMTHLTNLRPHIIRFPGGSISDVFFWNANNHVAPSDAPDMLVKADGSTAAAGYWFGKNNESWTLSVDNYYQMLQQTGNKGMITINYGYARYGTGPDPVAAAAHLAADWVRYDNGRTKYWEIGNENFGDWEAGYRINLATNKDGQPEYITGSLYGNHFKVFADSMRKAANEIGKTIHIGAVMVESASPSWATPTHRTWNSGLLTAAGNVPDFYVVHNYYTPYNTNSTASEILNSATAETGKVMSFVKQTLQTYGAAEKPVALDEWNIFATGSGQMSSNINGLHADLVLGEMVKHQYGLGARWDLANGWDNGNDHGLFNIGDEPGGSTRWNPRPAFYHLYYFRKFLGDRGVTASIANTTDVETYGSSFSSGEVGVIIVNKSTSSKTVNIQIKNFRKGNRFYWYTLTGGTDNGDFSRKVYVNGKGPALISGGPPDYHTLPAYSAPVSSGIRLALPPRSSVYVVIENQK